MTRYLDYSAGTIPGATIRGAGYKGVIRYVEDPAELLFKKHIRPAEYRELILAGVDVLLYWEDSTDDALGGYVAGLTNAQRARRGADWVGYPHDRPIIMTCDRHVDQWQLPMALHYMQGAEAALGNACTGVYGFWDLLDACIAAHVGSFYVQAGIAPLSTDNVQVWQRNDGFATVGGIECDILEIMRPWNTAPNPGPILPLLLPKEDNMYIRYGKILAILSGDLLIGLGGDEAVDAEANIAKGALCQRVGQPTWDALDQRSHRVGDNPRPVVVVPGGVK